uniref:Uncharacterized protein n=1 Tax=Setaria italica TaxID=4555 RepID=K3ZZ90_SETIT
AKRTTEIRNRTNAPPRSPPPARGRSASELALRRPSSMAPLPYGSPYYSLTSYSPDSYSPGAASPPRRTPRLGPPSSPRVWWPGPYLPSPTSTLQAPITPSPVYSPTPSGYGYTPTTSPPYTPTSPTFSSLSTPSYSPDYPRGCRGCLGAPNYCPHPTAYYSPTSPNYCPEEFNHRDHASPAPGPLPYYSSTSPIYGNGSTTYTPTAPGYFPGESSGWNHTSPARGLPAAYCPTSPNFSNCSSLPYSPVTPCYSPVTPCYSPVTPYYCSCSLPYSPVTPCYRPAELRDEWEDPSLAHGVDTWPEYCYCCSNPVEHCCCKAGDDAPAP